MIFLCKHYERRVAMSRCTTLRACMHQFTAHACTHIHIGRSLSHDERHDPVLRFSTAVDNGIVPGICMDSWIYERGDDATPRVKWDATGRTNMLTAFSVFTGLGLLIAIGTASITRDTSSKSWDESSVIKLVVLANMRPPLALHELLVSFSRANYADYNGVIDMEIIIKAQQPKSTEQLALSRVDIAVANNFYWTFGEKRVVQANTNKWSWNKAHELAIIFDENISAVSEHFFADILAAVDEQQENNNVHILYNNIHFEEILSRSSASADVEDHGMTANVCESERKRIQPPSSKDSVKVYVLGKWSDDDRYYIALGTKNYQPLFQIACFIYSCSMKTKKEVCFHDKSQDLTTFVYPLPVKASTACQNNCTFQAFILNDTSKFVLSSDSVYLGEKEHSPAWAGGSTRVDPNVGVDIIIFSKDRPGEVANLLASIDRFVSGYSQIHVVYKSAGSCAFEGYKQVRSRYPNIQFYEEGVRDTFRGIVLSILDETAATHIVPTVGEVAFIRPVNLRELAVELNGFDPLSSVQLRLSPNLSAFSDLLSRYKKEFHPHISTKSLLAFDSTCGSQDLCSTQSSNIRKKNLNDFWFVTQLNGPLYSTQVLLDHWQSLEAFSHPGDLEGLWYYRKYRTPKLHLMPTRAVLVSNEAYAETRPDHLAARPHDAREDWRCNQFLIDYFSAISTEFDLAVLPDTRVNISMNRK